MKCESLTVFAIADSAMSLESDPVQDDEVLRVVASIDAFMAVSLCIAACLIHCLVCLLALAWSSLVF
jgi:hypothetical protein